MKRQIGILMAVWLITSAFPIILRADTSYLLIQGPFGSGGSELTYKWQVNYPTGYLITSQDLLDAVFGIPRADGTLSDPVFGDLPYFTAGNSTQGASYIDFGGGSYFTYSFTLHSTHAGTDNAMPTGTSTVGWNFYVAGGSGAYGGTYTDTGDWLFSDDGQTGRYLSNGSYDGWVYGNTGYDAEGNPATTGSATAAIDNASGSDNPSDFSNSGANDVFMTVNVTPEGKFTILLSATTRSATIPQGTGYATMTITRKGGVITAGKLPDGESFSASGYLVSGTAKSQFVIDKALSYPSVADNGSSGFLFGTLTFVALTGTTNLDGTLEWVKPLQRTGAYPAAIDTNLNVIGSIYSPPTTKGSVLPGFTSGTLELSDTSALILSGSAQLTASDKLTVIHPGDKVKVNINSENGTFSGSFDYPGKGPKVTDFGGVLFQDQTIGRGFFLGPNGSGTVSLTQ